MNPVEGYPTNDAPEARRCTNGLGGPLIAASYDAWTPLAMARLL